MTLIDRSLAFIEKKQHGWLHIVLAACLLLGMLLVYKLGFGEIAHRTDTVPERLRDFTFPVWEKYSALRHGFLVFLTAEGFDTGKAYANHATPYLFLMYALHKTAALLPQSLSPRVLYAFICMALTLAALVMLVLRQFRENLEAKGIILYWLSLVYFLTSPTYWISSGKFNLDNPFPLIFPALLFLAYQFAYQEGSKNFWLAVLVMSVLSPFSGVLIGLFLIARVIVDRRTLPLLAAGVLIGLGILFYAIPGVIASIIGFKSENSSWLFRAGLDGDRRYYSNFFFAVLNPHFYRPAFFLLVPVGLLVAQWGYTRWLAKGDPTIKDERKCVFLQIVFSLYLLTLLFWPQAVSIHPYLYDHFLLAPIGTWIVINFASSKEYGKHFLLWAFALGFLITFNLTEIAQAARCTDCYYPDSSLLAPRAAEPVK